MAEKSLFWKKRPIFVPICKEIGETDEKNKELESFGNSCAQFLRVTPNFEWSPKFNRAKLCEPILESV